MKKNNAVQTLKTKRTIATIVLTVVLAGSAVLIPYTFSSKNAEEGLAQLELLYVQVADSGSYVESEAGASIVLTGVSGATIWFADRPGRLTGLEKTTAFVDRWGSGTDSFASNPPNAALEFITEDGVSQVVVLSLSNPQYDSTTEELTYAVVRLTDATVTHYEDSPIVSEIPLKLSHPVLFIDTAGNTLPSEVTS